MNKPALSDAELIPAIKERWSPRAFSEQVIHADLLHQALEAARWAPSCFNEQPWRLLAFSRDASLRADVEASLNESNHWAKRASHLLVMVAKKTFSQNDRENRHAPYDTGAAAISLVLEAQSLGISAHQMAGFDQELLSQNLEVPVGYELMSVIALGYESEDKSQLSEALQAREQAPRQRKALSEIASIDAVWSFD